MEREFCAICYQEMRLEGVMCSSCAPKFAIYMETIEREARATGASEKAVTVIRKINLGRLESMQIFLRGLIPAVENTVASGKASKAEGKELIRQLIEAHENDLSKMMKNTVSPKTLANPMAKSKVRAIDSKEEEMQRIFPGTRPIYSAPSLYRLNGCGTGLYGNRDFHLPTQTYITTYCICFILIPVVALCAYRVQDAPGRGSYYFIREAPLSSFAKNWNIFVLSSVILLSILVFVGIVVQDNYNRRASSDLLLKKQSDIELDERNLRESAKIVSKKDLGFEITFPGVWIVNDKSTKDVDVIGKSPGRKSSIAVKMFETTETVPIKAVGEKFAVLASNSFKKFKLIEKTETRLGDIPAYKVAFTFENEQETSRLRKETYYFCNSGERGYVIISDLDDYVNDVDGILKSFKLLKTK